MQEREFLLAGEKHPLNGRRDRRIPASLAPSAGMHVMGTDHICAPGGTDTSVLGTAYHGPPSEDEVCIEYRAVGTGRRLVDRAGTFALDHGLKEGEDVEERDTEWCALDGSEARGAYYCSFDKPLKSCQPTFGPQYRCLVLDPFMLEDSWTLGYTGW
ncbi:hypothetical protein An15g02500 [Aspergillus niger]|uniref:Uncharacterized protein n=2 Tax=Aspergillus niger TaxID=5061 RepID=A2R530_ASPNC|nr:hypothetical protein An15g02500 [Aspergillus niger]CAL00404.1 hypothetical protein An15g02500 [Aspergillus niger]